MKELRRAIKHLIDEEWIRANDVHKPFVNAHEAAAVIREEIEEAKDALDKIEVHYDAFWQEVKEDEFGQMADDLERIYKWAQLAACECVQVGAMAEKALLLIYNTMEEKKEEK